MNICVAGWYLEKFDDFYSVMHRVNKTHPVHIVSNRSSDYIKTIDLPCVVRDNTGLEWGAYNFYLMYLWDKKSDVLFTHDDVRFAPFIINGEVHPPEELFDRVASMPVDQAYIFGNRSEDAENYGRHGRMVFCSAKFLAAAKEAGGFWFDSKNRGYTEGSNPAMREEMGCMGYNAGILAFHKQAEMIGGKIHYRAYVPSFGLAVRGEVKKANTGFLERISQLSSQAKNKLHLGCGDSHFNGFTNVDLHSQKADVLADAAELPFKDCSFDWIESHHLIEHLTVDGAKKALQEWFRVLAPGGYVFMSCPDLVACVLPMLDSQENPKLWRGFVRAIYGEDGPGMRHQTGYCRKSLEDTLQSEGGFKNVEVRSVVGFRPTPSLLAIARKELQ